MASITQQTVETKIPARMDRLPWSRWHWLVVVSLGTVWILDGLEVTIKGTVGPAIMETLGFSTFGVAAGASVYLLSAILGALFWGGAARAPARVVGTRDAAARAPRALPEDRSLLHRDLYLLGRRGGSGVRSRAGANPAPSTQRGAALPPRAA